MYLTFEPCRRGMDSQLRRDYYFDQSNFRASFRAGIKRETNPLGRPPYACEEGSFVMVTRSGPIFHRRSSQSLLSFELEFGVVHNFQRGMKSACQLGRGLPTGFCRRRCWARIDDLLHLVNRYVVFEGKVKETNQQIMTEIRAMRS
jgi:hypothetical protein